MSFLSSSEQLRIYRGRDYPVNGHITIHIPSLGEIADFGENEYFSLVHFITATPTDLCFQLWDLGIDFTKITDYLLFLQSISRTLTPERSGILFGELDLTGFEMVRRPSGEDLLLLSPDKSWYIDECTYQIITDCLRTIHKLPKNVAIPANEGTKEILIEDAREAAAKQARAGHQSHLMNLISAMVNSSGFKYNHEQVWDMKINAFMDSVYRIGKIKNADMLLQSGYSGFGVDLKKISKKQLDWMGNLD